MIKPRKLEMGDTIAFIAPSSGLGGLAPHRVENAKKFLISKGFQVKEFPTSRSVKGSSSATPQERVNDIHNAFKDPEVKAIICTAGGLSSNELLNLIDYKLIKENPKIFCGYSDISIIHYAFFKKADLITFYGPAAMTQFGEFPHPLNYTYEYFLKAVSETEPIGKITPSEKWTDELLNWFNKEDLKRPRKLHSNEGFIWLKEGKIEGNILGGCLSSILKLKGTEFDLDYTNKILFIEIPEGQDFTKGEPLKYVDSQIMDLRNSKVFDKIKGLIVGRGFGYTEEEREEFKKIIIKHTENHNFPVLFNTDIGHSDPMITIPLGVKVTLDSEKNLFSIDEEGVID